MRLPNYRVIEKMAESRQAAVYTAYRKGRPDRLLALKVLKATRLPEYRQAQFAQKIEQLKVLNDPLLITPISFEATDGACFITQDYFDGVPLDELAEAREGISLRSFFPIACRLAQALARVHEAGIVHGGIKPHNILVNAQTLDIRLIDFISALDVRDISHFVYDRSFVRDTLSYTSPEQTGRINHRVAFASDLYSLGIVLYELLTGRLPFLAEDPLELIHSHLAEEAPRAHVLNPGVPAAVSAIVAKLMLKAPEKRYRSGNGLLADLEHCRDEYATTGTVREFPLEKNISTHRVTFISKMVGRDREAEVILQEYEQVACGSFRSLLISGLSGIGKTRLIQELQKPIVRHKGYFTSGKFDVYQRNTPYSSLIQAFRHLMRTFLTESDERVAAWKGRILEAVGRDGRVLTEVIPELERLIGPQPEVKQLPPVESLRRFHDLFDRFLTCLASEENPLTIFIDDLQWCDTASFDFLAYLFANYRDHPYLFFLGAYRHNEVDSSHPLAKLIQDARKGGRPLQEIRLGPLQPEHCHEMVSYILDSPLAQTQALSDFISALSEGNPLFVSESLSYLHGGDLLFLDEQGQWRWDLDKIHQSHMPTSVVALFGAKIQKLPLESVDLLEYCACMGNTFSPTELAAVRGMTLLQTFAVLRPALEQGLLIESKDQLQFIHDRVQEAALAAIPAQRRRQIHWQVGNYLYSCIPHGTGDIEQLDNLFTIASHLNLGKTDSLDAETAYRLSEMNYHAGNKALNSLATEAANGYYDLSRKLLPDDCWEDDHYPRTFSILQKAAKTELMCGNHEASERLLNQLLDRARTDLDRAECLAEQTTSLSSIGNFIKAIETANRGLAYFGKAISTNAEEADARRRELMAEIASQDVDIWETILNMPFTTDRKRKVELAFYSELIPDLYMSGLVPQLYLSAAQSTQHCLSGGMDESVIYSFSIMGLQLGEQGEFDQAFRYEDLARDLSARYPNTFGATRGMNGIVWCNAHSRSHPREIVEYCLRSIQCGKNCGDLYNAGLSYGPLMWNLQVQGADMPAIEDYARECLQFSERYHLSFSVGLAEAMQAGWIEPMKREYASVSMEDKIRQWEHDNHIASAGSYYVHRALTHYYLGEYQQAQEYLVGVERYLSGLTDNVLKREWYVFRVLNVLRLYEEGHYPNGEQELLDEIRPTLEKIEAWARLGPLLRPYLAFVYAELERVTGDWKVARGLYLDAIDTAHEQEYTFLEGHLNECLGELLLRAGQHTERAYFAEAVRLYRTCGAERKEISLIERYPECFEDKISYPKIEVESSPVLPNLDVGYLTKSSLAIAAEIEQAALLEKIMNVVIESSGAQHGYLLIEDHGELVIPAESHVGEKRVIRTPDRRLEDATDICQPIVRYVYRTGEKVFLGNAAEEGAFKDNPEVQRMALRSVLCIPVIKQSRTMGVLYLENRLADSVFTAEKAQLTELLTSQAAIALDNAMLFEKHKRAEQALRDRENELRLIMDTTPALISYVDTECRYRRVNRSYEVWLGRGIDEIQGRTMREVLGEAGWQAVQPYVERALAGELVTFQQEQSLRAGAPRWIDTTYMPDRDDLGRTRGFVVHAIDIGRMKEAEDQVRRSLREKEALLAEVHHRVKNNLQIIHGMLNLQLPYIQDERAVDMFKESQNRIFSMALIHEKLYRSESLARIDLAEYIRSLVGNLFLSYGVLEWAVRLEINVEDIRLNMNTIIPCALIINELVSNSLKHAFPDATRLVGRGGEIRIDLHRDADRGCVLRVSDNGVGLPEGFDLEECESLGLRLVSVLVRQLQGTLQVPHAVGHTEFVITFRP